MSDLIQMKNESGQENPQLLAISIKSESISEEDDDDGTETASFSYFSEYVKRKLAENNGNIVNVGTGFGGIEELQSGHGNDRDADGSTSNLMPIDDDNLSQHSGFYPFSEGLYHCNWPGCDKKFQLHDLNHRQSHDTPKSFTCNWPTCKFSTDHSSSLEQHKQSHLDYQCNHPNCSFACWKSYELERHKNLNHNQPSSSCLLTTNSERPKKHQEKISLQDKYDIITRVKKGEKKEEIRKAYGLKNRSNINRIMESEVKIIAAYESLGLKQQKNSFRVKLPDYPDIEEALVIWAKKMLSHKLQLSSELIKSQAQFFAKALGHDQFKASIGYLRGLRRRHKQVFVPKQRELDQDLVKEWKLKLEQLIADVDSNDIFSCGETGLFWRLLPNKTFSFDDKVLKIDEEKTKGANKKHLEKATVLLLTNMTGTSKQFFIIGRSKNPSCFQKSKNEDESQNTKAQYKMLYYDHPNAWITKQIFLDILTRINDKMKTDNRKIVLFVSNSTPHFVEETFSNIQLVYFPVELSWMAQPMELGINRSFRCEYKKNLLSLMLIKFNGGQLLEASQINWITAIDLIIDALTKVTTTTIVDSFKKAFFVDSSSFELTEQMEFSEVDVWKEISKKFLVKFQSFDQFVNTDDFILPFDDLADEKIIKQVKLKYNPEANDKKRSSEVAKEQDKRQIKKRLVTSSEAFVHLQALQLYFKNCKDLQVKQSLKYLQDKLTQSI